MNTGYKFLSRVGVCAIWLVIIGLLLSAIDAQRAYCKVTSPTLLNVSSTIIVSTGILLAIILLAFLSHRIWTDK